MSRNILANIIEDFNPDKFIRFFREKNRTFAPRKEELSQYNDESFKNGLKLGEINFAAEEQMIICIFEVNQPLSERSGKKAQYEKGKRILREQQADTGIFIFCDKKGDFRFSLIYANYLGKGRDWSTFRRFTYFVSREFTNKTFLQRIGDGEFSTIENIKEAFSVDKVTDKFFEEFREIFEKTKQEFERSNKTVCLKLKDIYEEPEYREQINKLTFTFLGRIIFIYFLQRKGWIEDKTNFLREVVEDKGNHGLYVIFLRPLFFDVFAKKEAERPASIKAKYKNTPYLNGGLFEKSALEEEFPAIFFDDKFIKKVILDFFEVYNFTVDENTPDDQEVSIDPEMLGKVFENTLAEEERGQKGTFYTPREIVHFMVKESLWQFLRNETSISEGKLKHLVFNFDLLEFSKEEIRLIDNLLENIKVLDPAVGSAAFPVEMMQILVALRKLLDAKVGRNINEVELKKRFIKNNLYGVDIDAGAIEIAKLRLWLSLVVDYNKTEVEPLPNLDFQFRLGNSLQEKIGNLDIFNAGSSEEFAFDWKDGVGKTMQEMLKIKDEFYSCDDDDKKKKLKKQFDDKEHQIIVQKIKELEKRFESSARRGAIHTKEAREIARQLENLKQKVKDGTYKLFKPDFHFSEVFDRKDKNGKPVKGFDIVIGNPPYGVKVEDDIKEWHGLGSKDSYGIFISTSLKRFLKVGGVLSFIVSDTWLTIKTHRELREQVLAKQMHKVVRMHQDCFEATVNACIISVTNSLDKNKELIAADFTNISTREEIPEFREKLCKLEKFVGQSTPKFAVYQYKQDLIKTNSNLPIFVGSPKLFEFMNDTTCKTIEKEVGDDKEKRHVEVRQIPFNGKIVELVRFGDIADVRQGLATGDNDYYLFQNPEARGSYKNINEFKEFLLTEKDLAKIVNNEGLRLKIIEKGFHRSKSEKDFDENLWFLGRYIVPYDKGEESDTEVGFLPNYYVPTNYFINWSCEAVKRLKTHKNDSGKVASRFQNADLYFKECLTFSTTGIYAPTFRIGAVLTSHKSSGIFFDECFKEIIFTSIFSRLLKFFSKVFINHDVDFTEEPASNLVIINKANDKIVDLAYEIIRKQKQNCRYDYMSHEQKQIDKLVYEMYNLSEDDIHEVETWYARRYPKLARFCDI